MAYEADTTQDILKRCFNTSLSTLQVTLKGGAAISLGAVRILGTASAIMQGTTTYGLEVDVQRLPNNVSPNISSMQNNISLMQEDISVMQNYTSQIKAYASTIASAIVNENVSRVRIADTWTSGVHGVRSAISTAAVRIAHGSSTALKRGMLCRAHRDNTTVLYVGLSSGVTGEITASTCGDPLEANQGLLLEVNNSFTPYAIANAADQKLHYLGM